MDEAAFVESLFAPEMRSTSSLLSSPLPFSCGRVKTRMESDRSLPPTSNTFVPPPPNSLLGGGIALSHLQAPYQPSLSEDVPLFVRLHEDDMFSQMLTDQDFSDFHHHSTNFKKENENIVKPLVNTSSLALEPLDLPRDNEKQCLNDSTSFQTSGVSRHGSSSSHSASNSIHGYTLDGNGMPFGLTTPVYFAGEFTTYPPARHSWIQDEQGDVSTLNNINYQRVHTLKHMMTGVGMMQQQPSPGAVDMFNAMATSCHYSASPELWISTSRNDRQDVSERKRRKQSFDVIKTLVEHPPLTISPPASLTDKVLKELIVSTDFETPTASRQKRARNVTSDQDTDDHRAKLARTTSTSPSKAAGKSIKGKKCVEFGCTRRAQSNSRCKAHGGGARCQYAGPGGCIRSSQGGGFCRAHGGGKRCEFPGCTRGQQRKGRCYIHGGIRKCQYGTCEKKDRGNGFCISHGGGKRCEHPNCSRAVRRGLQCQIHETQLKARGETVLL
ncbi:unnamed protein product [Peronospora farinosa]|uniref:WRKY transcription factor 19 n=1 Tax=Peronospora farinosa TaxID=134698 RepID=A0AAV0SUJ2_9STRA|nr:unnamed protein product [Peronospora farinosa]CAI5706210.1 unnamed protein product [Peronospora farinosa]